MHSQPNLTVWDWLMVNSDDFTQYEIPNGAEYGANESLLTSKSDRFQPDPFELEDVPF
jgi:hypothetical protein